jgi:hypothetical protein
MTKKKDLNRVFKNKFKHSDLLTKLTKYDYMSCYSFNKRNNKTEYDELTSLFNVGYPFDETKVQSIDFVISGTTSGQFLITAIVGRLDKKNMFDRDVFNIFPESSTGDTYSIIQSLHFKDENGQRLTNKYSSNHLTTDQDKIEELYKAFLTGKTNHFTIDDYSSNYKDFIKACHMTYKRYL